LIVGIGLLIVVGVSVLYGEVVFKALDGMYGLSRTDRGFGSGATGRVEAWKWTWELFARNPILGVGFRSHEFLLKTDSSSHNGYLATLAEIGILGFLGLLFLVARGLGLLWAGSRQEGTGFSQSILFGLCIGYLLLAIFERYLINVGNPTSLLFLISIMRPGSMEDPEFEPVDELRADEPEEPIYGHS